VIRLRSSSYARAPKGGASGLRDAQVGGPGGAAGRVRRPINKTANGIVWAIVKTIGGLMLAAAVLAGVIVYFVTR
jgi:hypothetical protein